MIRMSSLCFITSVLAVHKQNGISLYSNICQNIQFSPFSRIILHIGITILPHFVNEYLRFTKARIRGKLFLEPCVVTVLDSGRMDA
jgi:hypothetical protein